MKIVRSVRGPADRLSKNKIASPGAAGLSIALGGLLLATGVPAVVLSRASLLSVGATPGVVSVQS